MHKVYLSAILGLYDRRIVSFITSERNDNPLVFKTFDKAVKENPNAQPLFHSDRGFQYTGRTFHHKIEPEENFIFFYCPLDGGRFNYSGLVMVMGYSGS